MISILASVEMLLIIIPLISLAVNCYEYGEKVTLFSDGDNFSIIIVVIVAVIIIMSFVSSITRLCTSGSADPPQMKNPYGKLLGDFLTMLILFLVTEELAYEFLPEIEVGFFESFYIVGYYKIFRIHFLIIQAVAVFFNIIYCIIYSVRLSKHE